MDPAHIGPAAAFLVGLLGSVHCVGMCGGIAGALALGVAPQTPGLRRLAPFLLAYNLGRISTYALAGALAGVLGAALSGLVPARTPARAFALGTLWGWLPCGMVYAVLAWSVTTAHALDGAVLMAAFGLGTLPMLLTLGAASRWLGARARNPLVRQLAGLALIAMGIADIWLVFAGTGPVHHH